MNRFATFVVALATALVVSCGGSSSSPAAPSTPTTPTTVTTTLRVVNGLSQMMGVAGAMVQTPVATTATDGNGNVTVTGTGSFSITVDKAGFLGPYETVQKSGRTDLPMWELRGSNDATAVKQMVYGDKSEPSNPGLRSLERLTGPATLVYNLAQLGGNEVARLQSGALVLQAVIGFPVGVSTSAVAGTANFNIVVDPTISARAQTSRSSSGGKVTEGEITFKSLADFADNVIRHELGHAFGLSHHNGLGLMGLSQTAGLVDYSLAEKDNMQMMLLVATGTSFPYNDRSVISITAFTASASERTEVIICPIH